MKKLAVFSVIFPLALMVGWLGLLTFRHNTGVEVQLPIRAYDPRDLLSGHYLQFSVDYGQNDYCSKSKSGNKVCYCLQQPSTGFASLSWSGPCESKDTGACAVHIVGSCQNGRFEAGIERFFIPETLTEKYQVLPPGGSIKLKVSAQGGAQITDLLVDGKSIADQVE